MSGSGAGAEAGRGAAARGAAAAVGAVARRIVVPAREGRAVAVARGESIRVVDLDGGQVGDLFAFCAADPAEHLSAAHTRAANDRLFPRIGERFVSTLRRPLLELVEDDSPGLHDMLIPACDPARYEQLGVAGWHASCTQNLRDALAEAGIEPAVIPQPVNVFMNIPVRDGEIEWLPAATAPGASIAFRALDDLVLVVCACPQDVVGINGTEPSPLAIELDR